MANQALRALAFCLIAILVAGCSESKQLPPVEILHARFGLFTKSPDGKKSFTETTTVPLKEGQGYGWIIYLRTNKPSVKVKETIQLAGPAEWGISDRPDLVTIISSDKSSASVEKVWSENPERIFRAWGVSREDPPGPASITVNIEGVEQRFDFTLVR